MKTLFGILLVLFVCASVYAQAPFRRNYYTTNAAPAGSINWVDVSTNSYTLGDVGIGTTPITAQKMTLRVDDLRTTPINGLFLTNAQPSTAAITVEDSPSIYWSGGAWLTGSLSNAPVSFRGYVVPVVGATAPSGVLNIDVSLNNGAFVNAININQLGVLATAGNIVGGNVVFSGSVAGFYVGARSTMSSSANGAMEMSVQNQTSRSTLQANIPQVTKISNFAIGANLDSGFEFTNIGASQAVTNTLPTAVANQHYWFYVDAAQIVSVKASGTDVIRWGSTVSAAAGGIWSSQVGSKLHIRSPKAGLWVVDGAVGGWTLVAPRTGNATLIAGAVTVANTTVTANTAVFYSRKTLGGTAGAMITYTTSPGTSFTITSDLGTDTSTFSWRLEEIPN